MGNGKALNGDGEALTLLSPLPPRPSILRDKRCLRVEAPKYTRVQSVFLLIKVCFSFDCA